MGNFFKALALMTISFTTLTKTICGSEVDEHTASELCYPMMHTSGPYIIHFLRNINPQVPSVFTPCTSWLSSSFYDSVIIRSWLLTQKTLFTLYPPSSLTEPVNSEIVQTWQPKQKTTFLYTSPYAQDIGCHEKNPFDFSPKTTTALNILSLSSPDCIVETATKPCLLYQCSYLPEVTWPHAPLSRSILFPPELQKTPPPTSQDDRKEDLQTISLSNPDQGLKKFTPPTDPKEAEPAIPTEKIIKTSNLSPPLFSSISAASTTLFTPPSILTFDPISRYPSPTITSNIPEQLSSTPATSPTNHTGSQPSLEPNDPIQPIICDTTKLEQKLRAQHWDLTSEEEQAIAQYMTVTKSTFREIYEKPPTTSMFQNIIHASDTSTLTTLQQAKILYNCYNPTQLQH